VWFVSFFSLLDVSRAERASPGELVPFHLPFFFSHVAPGINDQSLSERFVEV